MSTDYIHIDDLPDLESMKDYLEGVVEAVYKDGDIKKLDHCIEELCCLLDVEFSGDEPILKKMEK